MAESSKQWLLIGTSALFGSISTIALLKLLSRWDEQNKVTKTKNIAISCSRVSANDTMSQKGIVDPDDPLNDLSGSKLLYDEVVSEHLTRNIQFFGLESQRKVTESFVIVIGLGGVGSHAASMLLRSGVGRLLLVDFDQVSLSSLNRHAVATRDDVGTPKAVCLQKHFSSIFPECQIEARVQLYDASSEEEILSGQPDFVLDCIDNIDTKLPMKNKLVDHPMLKMAKHVMLSSSRESSTTDDAHLIFWMEADHVQLDFVDLVPPGMRTYFRRRLRSVRSHPSSVLVAGDS